MNRILRWEKFFQTILLVALFVGSVPVVLASFSPEARVGRRLFEEPRFAQFFCEHCEGNGNAHLVNGDPALEVLAVAGGSVAAIKNTGADQSISCASCHIGSEYRAQAGLLAGGVNTFGDFAARSPVTKRSDRHQTTVRNAPSLVELADASKAGWGLLHWDGEFSSMEELIVETFTGRNFGWLPAERTEARRHFARIIREDDGQGELARRFGKLSYAVLLRGVDASIPGGMRVKESFRLDVAQASDDEILHGCARLVAEYLAALQLSRGPDDLYAGSPYDAFLAANHLPQEPNPGEIPAAYARRLHTAVAAMRKPRFIDDPARKLKLHDQPFRFGELELRGLRIFFRSVLGLGVKAGAGNCAECHVPPSFTNGSFHNTGEAQMDYDAIHGVGAFAKLAVPGLAERSRDEAHWLPPTSPHPTGTGVFLSVPSIATPGGADLGLWNVYGNSHLPAVQAVVEKKLNADGRLSADEVLTLTLARFKTPSVRDLGQSAPYLHTGRLRTIEEVVTFYQQVSDLAKEGKLRNAPPEFAAMKLDAADLLPLAAFLRSLNEDCEGPE